ncbi:polygalacturonase (GH28) [Formosa agariphila KMM 3901]|uniref:Polygalacturonase (GH28) n=1 Tax=Formosa agariphila (strain DSM 15362 / KCTC 12365 / LMG 23005 / KMM 3901 / M-2Alg 35-1) TaxID=1347342 RepID=T2KMA8_FORAG|nr:glycosyl hydrolase family 28 protein [Formosa agariphila]CDF79845.1 polygalacturonase (GH28) [Formosa agariphila KMM 3901]
MNSTLKIVTLICTVIFFSFTSKQKIYNIKSFGAKGDSLTINTIAIQKTIDKCSKNGGGLVQVSDGIYITGTIILKDNVTLEITENAKLVGSSNPQDYVSIDTFIDAVGQERGTCLIGSINASNIGIKGEGVIDGNGAAFLSKNLTIKKKALQITDNNFGKNRPFLLRFVKSENITLKNIHIREAAAWACHFYQSKNILVDNINIYNHANKNNDGIDLDSSHDVIIKNCNIDSGDDAICIKSTSPLPTYNVQVSNCILKSDWGTLKFGTESMGDFYNIDIRDCKIYDTKGGGIKILSVDGANIYDITIENIEMDNVDMPIFIRLGERLNTYRGAEQRQVGTIDNVLIKNIKATTRTLETSRVSPPSGILITGTPNHNIGTIQLENIHIELPGGGTQPVNTNIPEDETRYPEFSFFNVLPAYGLYARHIKELKTTQLTFKVDYTDERFESILKHN